MSTSEYTPYMYINLVSLIISFPGNFFIIGVNLLDFCKNRRLVLSDQLMFGFSVFSLLHAFNEGYVLYADLFPPHYNVYTEKEKHVFLYVSLSTLWFSALLSVHFCLKIVSINHWFYIGLQRKSPKLFPWTIIAVLIGFFFLSLYSALETNPSNTTSKVTFMMKSVRYFWLSLTFMIICALCAFLCLVSALTILFSLFKHMKRIQEKAEGSRSPNMEAYIRAIKTVTTLLTTNILIFCSVSILTFEYSSVGYIFCILISMCHISSTYFLIKGTKKLHKTLVEILNQCSCFMCRSH